MILSRGDAMVCVCLMLASPALMGNPSREWPDTADNNWGNADG